MPLTLESERGGFPQDNISDIIFRELTRKKTRVAIAYGHM